jgi:hypothetical protein
MSSDNRIGLHSCVVFIVMAGACLLGLWSAYNETPGGEDFGRLGAIVLCIGGVCYFHFSQPLCCTAYRDPGPMGTMAFGSHDRTCL